MTSDEGRKDPGPRAGQGAGRKRARVAALFVCAGLAGAAAGAEKAPPVLNENAYWRYHFTYGPLMVDAARMKTEGERHLGDRYVRRLKGAIERKLQRAGRDGADWREHVPAGLGPWSFDGRADAVMDRFRTGPPPADWMKPDFDDTDWLRQRVPYLVGDFYKHVSAQQVRAVRLRTYFEVPAPAEAGPLTLTAVYRGGIRIFCNGTEVARGHVADDGEPEVYPAGAYRLHDGEYLAADYTGTGYYAKYWKRFRGEIVLVTELPAWEELKGRPGNLPKSPNPDWKQFRYARGFGLSRAAYDRVVALRDRRLSATIDPSRLRRGVNVLAIEVRSPPAHPLAAAWYKAWLRNAAWYHAALLTCELRGGRGTVPTVLKRPGGVQVWPEDVHRRVYAPDFCGPGQAGRTARIVAPRNATCGAQIVVGAGRELKGLKVSAGPLAGGGAAGPLPARVLYAVAHDMAELSVGDRGRRKGNWPGFDFPQVLEARYGRKDVPYFDHLTSDPPSVVPADSAQAVWVSVNVPSGAAPGTYRGRIAVEAEGMTPAVVPLEVEVLDWRVPDAGDRRFVAGIEQSPYAVAAHYGVPLWSEAHFALLERSFRLLGRAGNDWLDIPVLANTEYGNRSDSPVVWVDDPDAGPVGLRADFTIADRLIDLAVRHWRGGDAPKVIAFTLMHPSRPGAEASSPMDIPVLDPATGRRRLLPVDHRLSGPRRRAIWKHIATTIHRHMAARGLAARLHWGHTWDGPGGDPSLYGLLKEFVPSVGWTKGCHAWGVNEHYTAFATVYNSQVAVGYRSKRGWRREALWLAYPRYWGTIIDCSDYSTPFSNRLLCDRAIVAGARGFTRVGADYWGATYLDGMRGQHYAVGVPNLMLLYPGRNGAETSIRFEVLCEGLQEAEARIFLEQALEKLSGERFAALKRRVEDVLIRHNLETLLDPPVASRYQLAEACARGWQGRSRRLYSAAAEAARAIGLDAERSRLRVDVPARGRKTVELKLRNWTSAERAWKLAAVQPWLRPRPTAGTLAPDGRRPVVVTVDGAALAPGKEAEGALLVTDPAGGRSETVTVTARVGEVFSIRGTRKAANAAPGEGAELTFTIFNHSGAALAWSAGSNASWAKPTPPTGHTPAGGRAELSVRLTAPEPACRRHDAAVTVAEAGGTKRDLPVRLHVVPPYAPPRARPGGQALPLAELPAGIFQSYADCRHGRGGSPRFWRPRSGRPQDKLALGAEARIVAGGIVAPLPHEIVYKLEGAGVKAFAAEVGPVASLSSAANLSWARGLRLHFEVVVDDGKRTAVVAQSGLMGVGAAPRLLVADGLAGAKTLRLRARADHDGNVSRHVACWAEPAFYK